MIVHQIESLISALHLPATITTMDPVAGVSGRDRVDTTFSPPSTSCLDWATVTSSTIFGGWNFATLFKVRRMSTKA